MMRMGKNRGTGRPEVQRDRKVKATCKNIFCGCFHGHPGIILLILMSTSGTANLTSSDYAKIQRHRSHMYENRERENRVLSIQLFTNIHGKYNHIL